MCKAANSYVVLLDARGKMVIQEENRKVVRQGNLILSYSRYVPDAKKMS